MSALLEIQSIDVHYGQIQAIYDLNFKVNTGEIVCLLGANGAGKTTILRTISGLIKPTKGQILFEGRAIHDLKAYQIAGLGLNQSPEGRMVFPDLTVKENLEMGAYLRKSGPDLDKDYQYMYDLFPKLKERASQLAGTLSGGEQQMLAIARAYMGKPKLLLLDEPSLGIAPILVQAIFEAIVEINKKGTTVLLVEQNAFAALKISHHGHVIVTGKKELEGSAQDLLSNEEVQKAYLGH